MVVLRALRLGTTGVSLVGKSARRGEDGDGEGVFLERV